MDALDDPHGPSPDNAQIDRLCKQVTRLLEVFRPKQVASSGPKLGLQKAPQAPRIYIGESADAPWYTLTEDNKQEPIDVDTIIGYVVGFSLRVQHNEKHGDKVKFTLGLDTKEHVYHIISSVQTVFSRGVISSLLLGDFTKDTLMRLTVKLGNEGKVVLPSIFVAETNALVKADKDHVTAENVEDMLEELAAKMGFPFRPLSQQGGA